MEFRHANWWNNNVYKAFREKGAIFCSCSGPKFPDYLIKTAEDIYVRFHGTERWYRHDYSEEEMKDWATRIEQAGAKRAWIYFNNDFEAFAIKNAHMLAKYLDTG